MTYVGTVASYGSGCKANDKDEGISNSEDLPLNISRDQCLLVCGEFLHTLLQSTLDRQ